MDGLLGIKVKQTQGFLEDGRRVPLTVIATKGNVVARIKTQEKDGYSAIQLGVEGKKKPTKAEQGYAKKAGLDKTPRFFREVKVENTEGIEVGKEVSVQEILKPGDVVNVIGVSKGKGFAGVVKRHHFRGGPRTHGQSDRERAPGSIGQSTTPGRVYKGKKMAGKMGHEQATALNLEVIDVLEDGTVLVRGLVPGHKNSLIMVKKIGENKKFTPLYKEVTEEEKTEETVGKTEEPKVEVETPKEKVEEPAETVKTEENVETMEEKVETADNVVKEESAETPEDRAEAEESKEEEIENAKTE